MLLDRPTIPGLQAYVDVLLRRAMEEGKFDNLPGAGKPLPDLDEPYDENWWLKKLVKRESISFKEIKK